jgi:ATP-dependent RNA helicase DHX36
MEDESDDEEIHVLAPSDPGATHVPVVVPDTLENPSRASRQTRFASADVLSCAFPSTGARRLNKVPSPHNPGLQPVAGRSSTVAPACAISTEWYAHNPKLYLTRYSEQHALQIDWERGTRGPEHGKEFCTTVRVPLPGMLAEPLCETAWARTKREAEGTAATAMCRKLSAMGLMDEPQQQKTRRSANTKRLKGAVAPSERSGSPIASLSGMRVRLPGAGALKMRTPHMKGLVECNHAHRLPEPAQLVLSKNLDDCLAELEHLDAPSVSPIPTEIAEDSAGAFAEHYHGDPTLSPTVDSSQWRSEVPDAAGEDDSAGQARLSIFASKGAILQAIRTSQVVLVSGPSGSGKSTQLCQYIMDDWQAAGFANKCSIVHCFPGSLVAESVASRVAAERCTSIGTCVGYHTHLSHRIPSLGKDGARVVFTTTATLMHRLQYDPFLADVTHILVDEVDSRTIQIDIILTYMRILLPRRDSLRLVVIAAGDQTNCRACVRDYFSQLVCVDVAGPLAGAVRACFLEEVLQLTQPDADARRLEAAIHRLDEETAVDLSLVTAVVAHIITTSVDGGILIFLPSAEMVEALCKTLSAAAPYSDASRFCITPLHATGTVDTVKRVYKPVDPGVRKIVISTSIAERELPVDDIGYVIDSGRTQERTYVSQTAMTFFGLTFATREECQRRRTRAAGGRDGCYFCLLSTSRAAALQSQKQPEMKRMPLAEAILLVQNLQMGNIKQFMSLTPDPPPPTAVSEAVLRLHEIGALTRETDALTPLGGQLAKLSCVCNPRIGKLLIIGTLFGVRDDALTIAAALCVRPILTLPSEGERAQAAAVHQTLSDGSFSDHHCVLRAYSQWVRVRQESGEAGATEFATAHYLSETNLQALDCIRPVLDQALAATGVVALPAATAARAEELRTGSQHIMGPLLRAAITSSLMSTVLQVKQRSGGRPGFCTQDNCRMVLHPSSVNAHRIHAELPARWLVFSSPVQHQSHILVRETTVASSAAMVVLSHGELWERVDTPTGAEIVVGDWIRFVCPVVGTFDRVRALREHVGVALAQVLSRSDSSATGEYVDRVFAAAFQFLREGLGAGGVALSPGGPGAAGGM